VSDAALRGLERQVEAGDVSARARLLAARLRAGELDEQRLRLAAHAGDRDVVVVLPDTRHTHATSCDWCLWPYGKAPSVVAAAAAARLLVPVWERLGDLSSVRAVVAAEAWVACPCEPCRKNAASIAAEIEVPSRTTGSAPHLRPAYDAARAAARPTDGSSQGAAMRAARDLRHALDLLLHRKTVFSGARVAAAIAEVGLELEMRDVKEAVERALRDWALR
jgi:hypothetical protein